MFLANSHLSNLSVPNIIAPSYKTSICFSNLPNLVLIQHQCGLKVSSFTIILAAPVAVSFTL
jgi:hypothetical protein